MDTAKFALKREFCRYQIFKQYRVQIATGLPHFGYFYFSFLFLYNFIKPCHYGVHSLMVKLRVVVPAMRVQFPLDTPGILFFNPNIYGYCSNTSCARHGPGLSSCRPIGSAVRETMAATAGKMGTRPPLPVPAHAHVCRAGHTHGEHI